MTFFFFLFGGFVEMRYLRLRQSSDKTPHTPPFKVCEIIVRIFYYYNKTEILYFLSAFEKRWIRFWSSELLTILKVKGGWDSQSQMWWNTNTRRESSREIRQLTRKKATGETFLSAMCVGLYRLFRLYIECARRRVRHQGLSVPYCL
jgi:hypothetical protein